MTLREAQEKGLTKVVPVIPGKSMAGGYLELEPVGDGFYGPWGTLHTPIFIRGGLDKECPKLLYCTMFGPDTEVEEYVGEDCPCCAGKAEATG